MPEEQLPDLELATIKGWHFNGNAKAKGRGHQRAHYFENGLSLCGKKYRVTSSLGADKDYINHVRQCGECQETLKLDADRRKDAQARAAR